MGTLKAKLIKNFLDESEVVHLSNYTFLYHTYNNTTFDEQIKLTNNRDTGVYSDYFTESIMLRKKLLIEKETKLKLLPTYSYWRTYTNNAVLTKHKDRHACEISCTIQVASCGKKWPIYVGDEEYILEPGDGLIYDGINNVHYRNNFEGDFSTNVFIHYVNAEGKYKSYAYDTRSFLGAHQNTRTKV